MKRDDLVGGKYKIIRSIGQGGMGQIWEAEHVKLGVRVCVKTINQELAKTEEMRRRFALEAHASAKLKSPHCVRVTDVDTLEDGTLYMVMEYLEGKTLGAYSAFAKNNVAVFLDWMIQTCSGLAEAHAAGLIHRDIKPSNIFIVGKDVPTHAKLLDFGIAKTIEPSEHDLLDPKTQVGDLVGTVGYMSPEQLRMERFDGRADIWAMGTLIYRVLAGATPFRGGSDAALLASVLRDQATPITSHLANIDPDLARAIMKCLEKDPSARHATALALAQSLAPFATQAGQALVNTSLTVDAATGASPAPGTGTGTTRRRAALLSRPPAGASPASKQRLMLVGALLLGVAATAVLVMNRVAQATALPTPDVSLTPTRATAMRTEEPVVTPVGPAPSTLPPGTLVITPVVPSVASLAKKVDWKPVPTVRATVVAPLPTRLPAHL
jgi:eukaryotic-like serine/threonine-protein kinase